MKKLFVVLAVAAVTLVSCKKEEVKFEGAQGEISFKPITSVATKAADAQLDGTLLTSAYSIYASATQKRENGTIENKAFFKDQRFWTDNDPIVAESQYHAWGASGAAPIYWPIGGAQLDFIAYAMPTAKHGTPAANYANEASDVASEVDFTWDTYENQVDLLYAVANGYKNQAAAVPMKFEHAQALIVFQAKVNTADLIKINSITIKGLKFNGKFTVDNTKNTLKAGWSDFAAAADKVVPAGADASADLLGENLTNTAAFAQVGQKLLVPEQARCNFVISYTVGTNTMVFEYNDLRSTWEMGKKYIYKLDIALNEILITEEVKDWEDAAVPTITLN